jgi:hypothetical protein
VIALAVVASLTVVSLYTSSPVLDHYRIRQQHGRLSGAETVDGYGYSAWKGGGGVGKGKE